jgi:hypothetical protein
MYNYYTQKVSKVSENLTVHYRTPANLFSNAATGSHVSDPVFRRMIHEYLSLGPAGYNSRKGGTE